MEFNKHDDITIILRLEDRHHKPMRVKDCVDFRVSVWTANRNNHLDFLKRDIIQEKDVDKLAIPAYMMDSLESSVVCYQYTYSRYDTHYHSSDCKYDKSGIVVTDIYWRNSNFHEQPSNPINFMTLNHLKNMIENESQVRDSQINSLKDYIEITYDNRLDQEIERSTAKDEEMEAAIKQLQGVNEDITNGLGGQIGDEANKREEAVKTLTEAIEKNAKDIADESARAAKAEEEIADDVKCLADSLQGENDRAENAEKSLSDALDSEVSRAKGAEDTLDVKILNERERATTAEGLIRDSIEGERDRAKAREDALETNIETEVSRAKDREEHLFNEVHDETARAKAAEKELAERLSDAEKNLKEVGDAGIKEEVARAKAAEAELAENISQVALDNVSNASKIADVENALNAEVSRATAAEDAINTALETESTRAQAAEEAALNEAVKAVKATEANKILIQGNTDALADEVARAKSAESALNDAIVTLQTESSNDTAAINAEAERAKAAEAELATAQSALSNALEADKENLADEIIRAKAAEANNASNISANTASLNILTGSVDVVGSVARAEQNAKDYADSKIDLLKTNQENTLATTLAGYATKQDVSDKIEEVIGTAPTALDTLGKIANALSDHDDVTAGIVNTLAQKANSEDVYTKNEVDVKLTEVNNGASTLASALADEVDRAKSAEAINAAGITANQTAITNLSNRVDTVSDKADEAKDKAVSATTAVENEVARATNAETLLSDRIDASNTAISEVKDEVKKNADAIASNASALNDEVARAKGKEVELDAKIAQLVISSDADTTSIAAESERAKAAEKEISDNLKATSDALAEETNRAKSAESALNDSLSSLSTSVADEASRAQAAETALSDIVASEADKTKANAEAIADEILRAKAKESELETSIAALQTGSDSDTAAIEAEVTRAKSAEKEISDNVKAVSDSLAEEVTRAKSAESANADAIASVVSSVSDEVTRATAQEGLLSDRIDSLGAKATANEAANTANADAIKVVGDNLADEVNRAKAKESENATAIASNAAEIATLKGDAETVGSVAKAQADAQAYTDQEIAKVKTASESNLTEALKPYATKEEVDGRIETVIGTAPSNLDTLGEIAEALGKSDDAVAAIVTSLATKAEKSDVYTKGEVDTKVSAINDAQATTDANLANEVTRAQAAEKVNADAIAAQQTAIGNLSTKVDGVSDKIDEVKSANVDNATAISAEVTRATAAENLISDKVEAVSAKQSANDTAIATLTTGLSDEVTRAKSAESANADAIASLQTNVSDLTTKVGAVETVANEAKTAAADNATAIVNEANRATTAEGLLSDRVDALSAKVTADEANIQGNTNAITALSTGLSDEIARAKSVESANADAIATNAAALAVINGSAETFGSLAHVEADAKHYTDDEIAKVEAKIQSNTNVYTKQEVDALIAGVDVSDQLADYVKSEEVEEALKDYAKVDETTVIKDSEGNVIKELVIDDSDYDDAIEVYTREQCDSRYVKKSDLGGDFNINDYVNKEDMTEVLTGFVTKEEVKDSLFVPVTADQYAALSEAEKNNGSLYIIVKE